MCGMWRWDSRAGTVSRNMGMRWDIGTGVEPPNPGLKGLSAWSWWVEHERGLITCRQVQALFRCDI